MRKMSRGRTTGPNEIRVEFRKHVGRSGLEWITGLFNIIFKTKEMPEEWRRSTMIPLYKNKGDIQNCNNYRGIKLLSRTMKVWERVVEARVRRLVSISENQFGFMPGRSTTEAIHLIRRKVPPELKGKFYRTVVRPAMLYGAECWPVKKSHIQKMKVVEMRMLRWMFVHIKLDKIRNDDIRVKVGVAPMEDRMREAKLRWFGHVKRRSLDATLM
ncbi:PREDICTED: uncharacterized protein LOC109236117 [Nicotiana attenuata]|uniref:uncharacterized protein LOC109236117 n=1 Tax=Nicotiana attenuata TaxID=49451 RepID=UPI000905C226|nr:PREDICTED: uncharacterized protein LOC109236117 [Nicotiana attenuata]